MLFFRWRGVVGLGCCVVAVVAACSSSEDAPNDANADPDSGSANDAAPSTDGAPSDAGNTDAATTADGGDAGSTGFRIATSDIAVPASSESTACYYFRTPNADQVAVRRWHWTLTDAVHDFTVFTTSFAPGTPGTVSTTDCGFVRSGSGESTTAWLVSGRPAKSELVIPSDDGTGKPLGFEIAAGTYGFVVMHLVNATGGEKTARVVLDGDTLPPGTAYTRTASFYSYNTQVNLPALSNDVQATQNCTVPFGSKFWLVTTHTHKRATSAVVRDSPSDLLTTTDWESPVEKTWAAPFHSFNGPFGTICTYDNGSNTAITDGNSDVDDEQCVGRGYFFPATASLRCVEGYVF